MTAREYPESVWRKSNYSNGTNGDCVEVAFAAEVAVRDSKDPAGGLLTVSPSAWEHFLTATASPLP
jgi:hypothetical protein